MTELERTLEETYDKWMRANPPIGGRVIAVQSDGYPGQAVPTHNIGGLCKCKRFSAFSPGYHYDDAVGWRHTPSSCGPIGGQQMMAQQVTQRAPRPCACGQYVTGNSWRYYFDDGGQRHAAVICGPVNTVGPCACDAYCIDLKRVFIAHDGSDHSAVGCGGQMKVAAQAVPAPPPPPRQTQATTVPMPRDVDGPPKQKPAIDYSQWVSEWDLLPD